MKLFKRVSGRSAAVRSICLGLGLVFAATQFGPALAATPGASGLSISPLRTELTINPGKSDKISITLKNITGGPVLAKASILDFTSDNATGNPKIITNPNNNDPNSIRSFITNLPNVPLATNETTTISIPVLAPANAVPGAYYGLIEYQAIPQVNNTTSGNNKVALSAGVSSLVFITVPGNLIERMELKAIHIYSDVEGNNEGLLFTSPPKTAGVELLNLGNGFEKPFGHVSLEDMSGKTIYSYELNGSVTRGIVLPGSGRIFKNPLKNIQSPGRYTLEASVSYGSGSAILIGKKTFWYLPVWLIVVIVLILLLLVGLALLARRRYRRSTDKRYRS